MPFPGPGTTIWCSGIWRRKACTSGSRSQRTIGSARVCVAQTGLMRRPVSPFMCVLILSDELGLIFLKPCIHASRALLGSLFVPLFLCSLSLDSPASSFAPFPEALHPVASVAVRSCFDQCPGYTASSGRRSIHESLMI